MNDLDKLDVRTVQRYLNKGKITQAEFDKYLADLPDLEAEAEFVDYEAQFAKEAAEEAAKEAQSAAETQGAAQTAAPAPMMDEPPPPATTTALAPEPPKQ